MSIFSETKLELAPNTEIFKVAVSNNMSVPMTAVMIPNKVIFYNENGDKLPYEIEKPMNPTSMDWHPSLPLLAIGWDSGAVTLCNIKSQRAKDEANYHQTTVKELMFNKSGDRMVSVDDYGNIAMWKELNCICAYDKECDVTSISTASFTIKRKNKNPKTVNLFFIGGRDGIVWYANDNRCEELCKLNSEIVKIMFYRETNSVVLLTSKFDLFQFRITVSNMRVPHKRVSLSLSAPVDKVNLEWISPSSFALTSHEGVVRIWNVENNRNYSLSITDGLADNGNFAMVSGKFSSCRYTENTQTLYAGTTDGKILGWRNNLQGVAAVSPEQWRALGTIYLGENIHSINTGNSGMVAINYGNKLSLLYETKLGGRMNEKFKIYYTSTDGIERIHIYDFKLIVKCFDLRGNKILVWNGATCYLYDINPEREDEVVTKCTQFDCASKYLCFHKNGVILIKQYMLEVVNFEGVVKQTLNFSKSEGEITGYDYGKGTLIIHTSKNFIRNISINKREVKSVGMIKKLDEVAGVENIRIQDIKVNFSGNKVLIIVSNTIEEKNTFFVWNIDDDNFLKYSFEEPVEMLGGSWEYSDPRFFGIYTIYQNKENIPCKRVTTFFVTKDNGIKKHDDIDVDQIEGIMAIQSPNILAIAKSNQMNTLVNYTLNNIYMKQFSGADSKDPISLQAIMNFNYHLTDGNMDEAHKSIKHIDSAEIWKNMAEMSIKTRRVDVAETCIANMKFARGAKALRELEGKDDMSKLASVAILLNMLEEAESLLKEAKRYDLLNELYQNENDMEKAIQIAESNDKINLKMTYFRAAKNYELHKNFDKAIQYYELSETGKREIPRMLSDNQQFNKLEEYAASTNDNSVLSYQGQIYESYEDYDVAKSYYQKAQDTGALVKIEIEAENYDSAEALCNHSNDTLACFWLARHYEEEGDTSKAMEFYKKGKHFSHTIRLATQGGEEDVIYSTALQAPNYVQCRAARYFEKKGYSEKAVILFMKGKNFKRALDLAVANNLGEYIQQITAEVEKEDADAANLGNMAEMFEEKGDVEKAFGMYIGSGQNDKALELLEKENIRLDKNSVKQLLPPKGEDDEKRHRVIRVLAKRLAEQNKCEVAAKLYIEVQEPILALKAVIKGGDPKKVIQFANHARSSEGYVLAANFLQNADWHSNPDLIKKITIYYKKAKRFDSLGNFYVSLAMGEIDEYKNYQKALNALQVAKKFASQGSDTTLLGRIDDKITYITKFLEAKERLQNEPKVGEMELKEIVSDPRAREALRIGDVYSTLFEYYAKAGENQQAWKIVEDMKKNNYQVNRYLDIQYLEQVSNAVGKDVNDMDEGKEGGFSPWNNDQNNGEIDEDIPIDDAIQEEFQFD